MTPETRRSPPEGRRRFGDDARARREYDSPTVSERQRPVMTVNANAKFQVEIYARDHWGADDRVTTEADAIARARKLISVRTCEGVRVMREGRANGAFTTTEVFKEMQRSQKPLTIQQIEEAPTCQTTEDLLGNRSRMTINGCCAATSSRWW